MHASATSHAAPASSPLPKWLEPATARAYFDFIRGADALVEVRIPKAYGLRPGDRAFSAGGWFDSFDALQEQLCSQIGNYDGGIYCTLNAIHDGLLARKNGYNKLTRRDDTTKDAEITRRKHLVIDLDPKRPSNISSTNEEHAAAEARAKEIGAFLSARRWPLPMFCDSGNGYHLVYGINLAPADGELVKNALVALAAMFPAEGAIPVDVDTGMFNPSRICKLVGTAAKKGENTPARPWRMSRILYMPKEGDNWVVEQAQLEALITEAPKVVPSVNPNGGTAPHHPPFQAPGPAPAPRAYTPRPDELTGVAFIESFIARHDLKTTGPNPWQGGQLWKLFSDPITQFNDGSCFIGVQANGAYFAGCHHNSAPWGWRELCAALGEERGNPELRALDAQYAPYDGHVNLGNLLAEASAGKKTAPKPPPKPAANQPSSPTPAAHQTAPSTTQDALPAPSYPSTPVPPQSKKFATIQGIAQEFLADTRVRCAITGEVGVQALRVWRGNIYTRISADGLRALLPHYHLVDESEFNARVRAAAANWRRLKQKGSEPLDLTRKVVGDIRAAVLESAEVWADNRAEAPMWLGQSLPWDDLRETALFSDGIMDLETGAMMPHSPLFFQTYAFGCNAPSVPAGRPAPEPEQFCRWVREDLFPGDEDALRLLQEWGGYVVTGRADLQKGMMIIGPPASGKSALLDLMGRIYGDAAVGLDLGSIVDQHTLCGCIGKRLLTIADARIDPTSRDSAKLIEKLLQMIGQDQMSLARKYLGAYVGKFPCRIMIAANEVPQIKETSNAIGRRFLILTTSRTIPPDRQDPKLVDRLLQERAAIIGWFIEGWRRLRANNYQWTVVEASRDAHADLRRAGGSVPAFIEDCMIISRTSQEADSSADDSGADCDEIYLHYRDYCDAQGLSHRISAIKFARAFETASGLQRKSVRLPSGTTAIRFNGARYNSDGLGMARQARELMSRAASASLAHSTGAWSSDRTPGSWTKPRPSDGEQQMRLSAWWDK